MEEGTVRAKDMDEHYDRRAKGADEVFCSTCGAIIKQAAEVCPKCGVRQKTPPSQPSTGAASDSIAPYLLKSRTTAAIFAILLGGVGVHKFYMGKAGIGFLYLIFCWTWIPAVIGLVEGISYLTQTRTDQEFTMRYVLTR